MPSVPPTSLERLDRLGLLPGREIGDAEVKLGVLGLAEAALGDALLHQRKARVELPGAHIREADVDERNAVLSRTGCFGALRELLLVVDDLLRRRIAQALLRLGVGACSSAPDANPSSETFFASAGSAAAIASCVIAA